MGGYWEDFSDFWRIKTAPLLKRHFFCFLCCNKISQYKIANAWTNHEKWEVKLSLKPIFVAAITNRTNKSSKKPTKLYIFMFIDTSYLYSWFPGGFSVTLFETKQLANSFTLQDQEELGGNWGKTDSLKEALWTGLRTRKTLNEL